MLILLFIHRMSIVKIRSMNCRLRPKEQRMNTNDQPINILEVSASGRHDDSVSRMLTRNIVEALKIHLTPEDNNRLSHKSAIDLDACQLTGIQIDWPVPASWNDSGGTRTYGNDDVLRLKFRIVQHLISEENRKLKEAKNEQEVDELLDEIT